MSKVKEGDYMSIWKKGEPAHLDDELIFEKVDNFFEQTKNSKTLEYREGQHTMALDVLDAITNKEILLIEAGVGIGKSYAYLIPLLYSYQEKEEFKGFIISTSTIALQEQLKEVILFLSKTLNINIPVVVAKGKTNYLCLKKLRTLCDEETDEKQKEIYKNLLNQALQSESLTKESVGEETWQKIHITNCNFQNCPEYYQCPYIIERNKFSNQGAIICNHDMLIQNTMKIGEKSQLFRTPNALVIDEAHCLEERARNASTRKLSKEQISRHITSIYIELAKVNDTLNTIFDTSYHLLDKVFTLATEHATELPESGCIEQEELLEYDSEKHYPLILTPDFKQTVKEFVAYLEKIIELYRLYEKSMGLSQRRNYIQKLEMDKSVFQDILLNEKSDYLYWLQFNNHKGELPSIYSCPKQMNKILSHVLEDKRYGKILTSATLTTKKDDYSYFSNNIGLDDVVGCKVLKEFAISSPYDYQNNSLIYYDENIPSPKEKDAYLEEMFLKIRVLLRMTDGRSLVLFTSKEDMQQVYERFQQRKIFDFPIYMQTSGMEDVLKRKFMEEEKSCLFATGAFWEGIDIQGKSLSSVIIARLPFPTVDIITAEKANRYQNGFKEVYLPEMILKLKQGIGRAIRAEEDKALITILDSRVKRFEENHHIFSNFSSYPVTDNMREVRKFVKQKIL